MKTCVMSHADWDFTEAIKGEIVDKIIEYTIKYLWSWDASINMYLVFYVCLFLIKLGLVLILQGVCL